MTDAWYRVASQSYGYLGALVIALIVFMAARKILSDQSLWRRITKRLPQTGSAGFLRVLATGGKKFAPGEEIPLPYEGTLGSLHSCDVRIPYRRVHMRSAFFWVDQGALHLAALHSDGFHVDGVPVEAGDEAVLRDGAELRIGDLTLVLRLHRARHEHPTDGPYVTSARQSRARKGHGEGLGAPGRGELRREQRLSARQKRAKGRAEAKAGKAGKKSARAETRRPLFPDGGDDEPERFEEFEESDEFEGFDESDEFREFEEDGASGLRGRGNKAGKKGGNHQNGKNGRR